MLTEIKKLNAEDVELAKELFLFFQVDDNVQHPVIPSDNYIHTLLSRHSFHVIIALQNGMVTGGLTAYELDMYKESVTEVFLYEIAVKPAYRKQGIGKRLIRFLKQSCAAKGIHEMYVGTEKNNLPAIKLYESTGGKEEKIAWFVYEEIAE